MSLVKNTYTVPVIPGRDQPKQIVVDKIHLYRDLIAKKKADSNKDHEEIKRLEREYATFYEDALLMGVLPRCATCNAITRNEVCDHCITYNSEFGTGN
ncbi:hypothetical protein ABEW34_21690 [Paenibacillus algorifonticola]|uniref:hypothetical protein n=1 Tax=Paenibacillus algorifonticola TaxID=684063 RepID=UPI003D26A714